MNCESFENYSRQHRGGVDRFLEGGDGTLVRRKLVKVIKHCRNQPKGLNGNACPKGPWIILFSKEDLLLMNLSNTCFYSRYIHIIVKEILN